MTDAELWMSVDRHLAPLKRRLRHPIAVALPDRKLLHACGVEKFGQSRPVRFADTPGVDALAANAVTELRFPLDQGNAKSGPRQHRGERGPRHPASGNRDIERVIG